MTTSCPRSKQRPALSLRIGAALCCALLLALAACASAPTAMTPTPTPTLVPTITPTPTPAGLTRLNLPATSPILPSPDGTMVAGTDTHSVTVTLYTLQGRVLAQASAPAGDVYFYIWLPDSSGLLIWPQDPSSIGPGPLSILSPAGTLQPTGLPALNAVASPDGARIAGETPGPYPSTPVQVAVVPRHGGAVRTLANGPGVALLGWQGADVVYAANGNIYAIPPSGGAARLLTSEGGVAWGPPEGVGPLMSPDGQALLLFAPHYGSARLVGNQLLSIPPDLVVLSGRVLWEGLHQAIGLVGVSTADVEVEVVVVDLVTGAVVRDTGAKAPPDIQALSGDWLGGWAHATPDLFETLHFTNLTTKQEVDLGPPPGDSGELYALGGGKFILLVRDGSYLVDPAVAVAA